MDFSSTSPISAPFSPTLRGWDPYKLSLKVLLILIALSLLLHFGIIFFATKYQKFNQREESAAIPVELVPSPKFLDAVDSLQETSKERPKDAKFSSSRNLKAEEDTSPEQAPTSLPQTGGAKSQEKQIKKERAKPIQKGRTLFSVKQEDLTESEKSQESLRADNSQIASEGFMEHLKKGQELKVSAMEFDYGQYILRMKQKLLQHWSPQSTVNAKMYDFNEVRVSIAVVLNDKGEIIDLRTLEASIFPGYDQEALRALKEAGPYPNPPKSLIQEDGKVYLPWDFVLSMKQWGMVKVD